MPKFLTFNAANYDGHLKWPERLAMIAQGIIESEADIIALQEIRFNPNESSTHSSYQSMGEQILREIKGQDPDWCTQNSGVTIVTAPAMYYPSMLAGTGWPRCYPVPGPNGEEWEGLAIISRLPILETGCRFLDVKDFAADSNRRNTQYAAIRLADGSTVGVFNPHFSYDKNNYPSNIDETIAYMAQYSNLPTIIMGDMNVDPQTPSLKDLAEAGFYDLWALKRPDDPGFTAPFDNPPARIDYIWANSRIDPDRVRSIDLVLNKRVGDTYPSDHFGVLAEIAI